MFGTSGLVLMIPRCRDPLAMPICFKPARLIGIAALFAGLAGLATAQDPALPPALPADSKPDPAAPKAKPPKRPPTRRNLASGPLGPAVDRGDATQGGAGTVSNTGSTPGTGGANTTSAAVNAPTSAELANAGPSETDFLARFLGIQDAPVKVYGWLQNSFTGNANGRPRNDSNFSVFPNRLADQWQGNQYYLVLEKQLAPTDMPNFGGRFDTLFGNDWQITKSYGLFDRAFKPNSFAGVDLPQMFAELHLPILTKNGFDIRGGRFYSRPASRTSRRSSGRCSRSPTCSTTRRSPCSASSRPSTSTSGSTSTTAPSTAGTAGSIKITVIVIWAA